MNLLIKATNMASGNLVPVFSFSASVAAGTVEIYLSDLLWTRYLWVPLLQTGSRLFYLFISLLVLVIIQFSSLKAVLIHINMTHALAGLPDSRDDSSNSSWADKSSIRQRTAIGLCPSVQIRMSVTGNNKPVSNLLLPNAIS